MMTKTRISGDGKYEVLPERSAVMRQGKEVFIGIPKELNFQENRVALVPFAVATLTAIGFRVKIEAGSGLNAGFEDIEYSEAGAEICNAPEEIFKCQIVLKVAPPTLAEVELMGAEQTIISPIHLPTLEPELIENLQKRKITAIAMEYMYEVTGSFPIVQAMSEIAGISSMLIAAELLGSAQGGSGILLGGIAGVPPAKVVILGAGIVAEFATKTALGLGAEVRIFDNNVRKLMRLQNLVGRQLHTSVINPKHLTEQLISADVAIGAMHSAKGRTPIVVSEDIVRRMKPGSVIVDVSIDQGGCFESSEMTTLKNPVIRKYDVIHYCVPNIPSRVPKTASNAIANILTSLMLKAESVGGFSQMLQTHPGMRNGVYTYKGYLTNAYFGERFGLKATNLDLLMTNSWQ
jgi:alanine dehydrogenase